MHDSELPGSDDSSEPAPRGNRDEQRHGNKQRTRREKKEPKGRPNIRTRKPAPPPVYPGSDLLAGANPKKVLRRLFDGDPLGIAQACSQRLRSKALILDLNRLHMRAIARIAHAAPRYRGHPSLDPWITGRIDQSIKDLIKDDREEERSAMPPSDPREPRFIFLSEALGIEPGLTRKACIKFNDLEPDVRGAFYAVVVEGKKINRYVAEGNGPPDNVLRLVRQALKVFSSLGGLGEIDILGSS